MWGLTETPGVCVCVFCVGVYLSRYSDLLQVDPIAPGAMGEIIIFKVMKVRPQSCAAGVDWSFPPRQSSVLVM